jgi:hypothetical protein
LIERQWETPEQDDSLGRDHQSRFCINLFEHRESPLAQREITWQRTEVCTEYLSLSIWIAMCPSSLSPLARRRFQSPCTSPRTKWSTWKSKKISAGTTLLKSVTSVRHVASFVSGGMRGSQVYLGSAILTYRGSRIDWPLIDSFPFNCRGRGAAYSKRLATNVADSRDE